MRGSRKFFRGGPTFFKLIRGERNTITTISRPSSARLRNAIKMAIRWWADGGPTLNAGLYTLEFYRGSGPILLRNPIFL